MFIPKFPYGDVVMARDDTGKVVVSTHMTETILGRRPQIGDWIVAGDWLLELIEHVEEKRLFRANVEIFNAPIGCDC